MNLENKVAVITGAGSGIGRAVALAWLENNGRAVLAGRNPDKLKAAVSGTPVQPDRYLLVPTDIRDPDSVKELFAKTKEFFGRVDVLFNNAGINAPALPMEEITYEDWMDVVSTNLTGPFLCTREAMHMMKNQQPRGGRIINNGSISAHVPRLYSAPYTCTKHGITGLTKSTSLDGRKHDILCGQIDIGNVATNMTEKMAEGVLQANGTLAAEPRFALKHVTEAFLYMASLPLDVNVPFITVMANRMPYMGRG